MIAEALRAAFAAIHSRTERGDVAFLRREVARYQVTLRAQEATIARLWTALDGMNK